ncbi:hypothetical protein ACP70R_040052 [Stipagrostis hirtigluma subsp. patula]
MAAPSSVSTPVPLPSIAFMARGRPSPTLLDVAKGTYHACDLDEVTNKRMWVTPQGWTLCLDPATASTFLWNPQAPAQRIDLPPLPSDLPPCARCVLSGRPGAAAAGCVLLLVEARSTTIWFCRASGGAWSPWASHCYDIGSQECVDDPDAAVESTTTEKLRIADVAACGGKFYFTAGPCEVGTLEFCPDPVFSSVAVVDPITPQAAAAAAATGEGYSATKHLLECGGEVYWVAVFRGGERAETVLDAGVYRLDVPGQAWRRVGDLGGDRAFLACRSYFGAWCTATRFGLRPNCVYWINTDDGALHVFNVENGAQEVEDVLQGLDEPPFAAFFLVPTDA